MIGDIVKQIKLAIQDAQDTGAVCNREYWEGVENGLIQAIDIINKQKVIVIWGIKTVRVIQIRQQALQWEQ